MRDNFPALVYFLENYWNEMGREIYGKVGNAAEDFLSESYELRIALMNDLNAAKSLGLFAETYNDPVYRSSFWNGFHRCLSNADVELVQKIVASARS